MLLETIAEAELGVRYPRVTAGKRACPPDDVGGYPGYAEFVAAIGDPDHAEYDSMLEWFGGRFDPECFDPVAANDRMPKKRASRRRYA